MKITVARDQLLNALRLVANVVNVRTPVPVLTTILAETEEGFLHLSGTDMEMSIRTTIPAVVEEAGCATLPARKIVQIVGALPNGDVQLHTDETQNTSVSCKKAFFRILGLDPKEYPRDSDFVEDWSFSMPGSELRRSLGKVSYCTSADETRHVLSGILLSVRQGLMTVAATDGRRLALVERHLNGEGIPDGDVILPAKGVAELSRMLEGEGDVTIRLSESKAAFEFGTTRLETKLVEGSYPNYRQVVPAAFAHSVAMPRLPLADALNRVGMVVSETSGAVRMNLSSAEMVVSAMSPEVGEAKEPIEVSYEGDPLAIAFNPVFFTEPVKQLECDQVIMQFNDEFSPVALSGDEGFLYVVMPMRT